MKLPRPLSASLTLLVGLLVLLLAAPATASFSSSTSFGYVITTGTWEEPDEDEEDMEPDPSDPDDGDEAAESSKVWVCKLTGPPDAPTLKAGPNPIEVAAAATTADRLNDKHGSPVVEDADTDCEEVLADLMEPAEGPPPQPEDHDATEADDAAPHGHPDAHGDTDEQHDTANDDDEEPLIEESASTADQPVEAHQGADGPAETSEPDGGEDQ